ncbi:hypothetical protein BS297_30670 [Rhodococcus erythropolis]|uniref:Lipoprotein n=1 Tax=Rhodococcus erythropolis TaxID=1833 RepID=A0A5N5DTU7_RHOER|nr:hypothetical protein [Rhodococcus erythropolis]AKE00059.1 hypothetical protein XU06_27865 [Rhodococcus erythropolis]KAB2581466.1 hypothetical protein BS297_30670 [Rhodococcus erythropolis]
MRFSVGATTAWTVLMLAGTLVACSSDENKVESSDSRYIQSGSVQTPDGQLMIAGPISSWVEGPTGMPQLPYANFSADDARIGASADDGVVIIHTGNQYGPRVEVTVSSVQSQPVDEEGWEESFDLEFSTVDGQMYLYDMESFSYASGFERPITFDGSGEYGMRVSTRGRLANRNEASSALPETYLLQVWKSAEPE